MGEPYSQLYDCDVQHTGFVDVVFLFDYPPHPDVDIEAWAAKVLGG